MLEDKAALITGASRGLGEAIALAYAQRGASLVINARSEESLRPVAEAAERAGARVLTVAGDVSDSEDARRLVEEAASQFGGIDILVNNAGILGSRVEIEEYPEDEWRQVLEANLTGPFLLSKAAIPHMRDGGSIINIVSGVSVEGRAKWGAYSVSKFGMEGLTQILAAELEERGIRSNSVDPGGMRTEMRANAYPEEDPMTLRTPHENTEVFIYLASDESKDASGQRFKAQEFREAQA